jgi:hypothetical protein
MKEKKQYYKIVSSKKSRVAFFSRLNLGIFQMKRKQRQPMTVSYGNKLPRGRGHNE